jgi:hypothetical protein
MDKQRISNRDPSMFPSWSGSFSSHVDLKKDKPGEFSLRLIPLSFFSENQQLALTLGGIDLAYDVMRQQCLTPMTDKKLQYFNS